ncbi:MAG: Uma2 family endonuclease, partial [Bryobacteraceae bacterium]
MVMQMVFSEEQLPGKVVWNPESPMTDDQYFDFCMANPNLRLERTAEGEIVIVPPAGWESSYRSLEASGQLRNWARRDGRGKASDASAEFILPTGAALSPDAAWVSNVRLAQLSKEQ